jgi:hypothetical protein
MPDLDPIEQAKQGYGAPRAGRRRWIGGPADQYGRSLVVWAYSTYNRKFATDFLQMQPGFVSLITGRNCWLWSAGRIAGGATSASANGGTAIVLSGDGGDIVNTGTIAGGNWGMGRGGDGSDRGVAIDISHGDVRNSGRIAGGRGAGSSLRPEETGRRLSCRRAASSTIPARSLAAPTYPARI